LRLLTLVLPRSKPVLPVTTHAEGRLASGVQE
jgi:hypothetical protein